MPKTPVTTTIADTPVPVAPVDPMPPPQPVKKQPIPAATDQEKIAKQLNDLYKTSQAGPKDPAKARSYTTWRRKTPALRPSDTCC